MYDDITMAYPSKRTHKDIRYFQIIPYSSSQWLYKYKKALEVPESLTHSEIAPVHDQKLQLTEITIPTEGGKHLPVYEVIYIASCTVSHERYKQVYAYIYATHHSCY